MHARSLRNVSRSPNTDLLIRLYFRCKTLASACRCPRQIPYRMPYQHKKSGPRETLLCEAVGSQAFSSHFSKMIHPQCFSHELVVNSPSVTQLRQSPLQVDFADSTASLSSSLTQSLCALQTHFRLPLNRSFSPSLTSSRCLQVSSTESEHKKMKKLSSSRRGKECSRAEH